MMTASEHLAESQIDTSSAGQRMLPFVERSHTVIDEAGGTAPDYDVTALEAQAAHWIGPAFTAPQEYARQTERNGYDGRPRIVLIAVLMQAEFGAGNIPIDQASIGIIVGESRGGRRSGGHVQERTGHGRPRNSSERIHRIVPIACSV